MEDSSHVTPHLNFPPSATIDVFYNCLRFSVERAAWRRKVSDRLAESQAKDATAPCQSNQQLPSRLPPVSLRAM